MIEDLKSKKTSDTVFIIGGGNSILKYLPDPSILFGKDIICTNNAYMLYPEAMILFFMDKKWFIEHEEKIKEKFKGITITADTYAKNFFFEKGVNYVFSRGADKGISTNPNTIYGTNSGHMAINIAVLMGYKKIVLLGFDMNPTATQLHYHSGHSRPSNTDRYRTHFLPGMKSVASAQESLGFKVYNINRDSCIKDFEFADLQTFCNINTQ